MLKYVLCFFCSWFYSSPYQDVDSILSNIYAQGLSIADKDRVYQVSVIMCNDFNLNRLTRTEQVEIVDVILTWVVIDVNPYLNNFQQNVENYAVQTCEPYKRKFDILLKKLIEHFIIVVGFGKIKTYFIAQEINKILNEWISDIIACEYYKLMERV